MDGELTHLPTIKSKLSKTDVSCEVHLQSPGNQRKWKYTKPSRRAYPRYSQHFDFMLT